MDLTQLANLREFIGGIAVLVTLIYLALQVRQNSLSVETSALSSWLSSRIAINDAFTRLDGAMLQTGFRDSRSISESDAVTFGLMIQEYFMQAQMTDLLFQRGFIPKNLWETEMGINAGLLAAPGVRQWWDAGGRGQVTAEFAALLESTPPGSVFGWTQEAGYTSLEEAFRAAPPAAPSP